MRLDDVERLYEMYTDPEVMRFMSGSYVGTLDELRERLAVRIAEYERDGIGLFATELRETGEMIGRCGHVRWQIEGTLETEVGYLLARAHWGKGLATEAARALIDDGFKRFPVTRLVSLIHPENVASQRVAAHNGLRYDRNVSVPEIPVAPLRLYTIDAPP